MCPVLILRFPMEGIAQQNIRLARISQRICHYFIVRRPSLLVRADEVSNRMSGLAVVHMAGPVVGNHCNVVATSAGQIRHLEPSLSCTTSLVSCRAIRKAMSNLRCDARNVAQDRGASLANR